VWFVTDGERLLVWTDATSGKVRRIRNDPRVTIAASDVRGRPRSATVEGTAHLLDDTVGSDVHRRLRKKYSILKPLIDLSSRATRGLRRRPRQRLPT